MTRSLAELPSFYGRYLHFYPFFQINTMSCNHKRVWEMKSVRTSMPDDFLERHPYEQAFIAEVFLLTSSTGPGPDWEPYGVEDGITYFKRQKPCEECAKTVKVTRGFITLRPGDDLMKND